MDAAVHDEAVQQDEMQSTVTRSSPSAGNAATRETSEFDDVARRVSEGYPNNKPIVSSSGKYMSRRRGGALRTARFLLRKVATAGIAVVAVLVALITWDYYNAGPWTRDGRVRVQVASVAPQISGQIKELRIVDNQFVRKGDLLYVIDPFDFEVALLSSKATLQQKAADLNVKELQSERRRRLTDLSASTEEKQIYEGNAIQAKAAVESARQQVAQSEINLQRTEVRSPVNGIVTNLLLREGDYAHQGAISIIDADSYWVDGYFEETKLARLCVGDRAEAKLMGYSAPIIGHIATVTRGVSVSNAAASTQGLPNVDPVYTWVRLAQRVPVRIAIDKVPPGVPLVSGLTATVTIRDGKDGDGENGTVLQRVRAELETSFFGLVGGASAQQGCIPDPS